MGPGDMHVRGETSQFTPSVSKLHTAQLGEMHISLVTDAVVSWRHDAVRKFGSDESRVERRQELIPRL